MRLGLLGPAGVDVAALGRAAEFLLNGARASRAIYLGRDGALDRAVATWARKLVGDDPSTDAVWKRAAEVARSGSAEQIDRFVQVERTRLTLRALEALPAPALRTIEIVGDRVAVLVHDKALLDEEDISGASIFVYGKSDGPLVKKIGARWFVTPGPIGCANGGIATLDEDGDQLFLTIYDITGKPAQREKLVVPRPARIRVQGDA